MHQPVHTITMKGATIMAATATIYDVVLRIQLDNGTKASGGTSVKNVNFSNIRLDATHQQLYDAGNAVAGLLSLPLVGLRRIDTNDLTDEE